jgi:purine-nucleoside phosphorylase
MTDPSHDSSEALARTAAELRDAGAQAPRVGIVLGSGLGAFADTLQSAVGIGYERVSGMTRTGVVGHAGRFVSGRHDALPVIAMQGRLHLYEGHRVERVVLGVRAMIALGARIVILTNAAGGIRDDLTPGTLMSISDHLNLTGTNSLLGPNDDALGPRFQQLSDAYDPRLQALASETAAALGISLRTGVYAGLLGPTYETPAEVRMLRTLGADAVGMSTVLETIAARHMGARVLGISCITNRAAGLSPDAPSHAEVEAVASATRASFVRLLGGVLDSIARAAAPDAGGDGSPS